MSTAGPTPSIDLSAWTGRIDGEGPQHARWHQLVRAADAPTGPSAHAAGGAIPAEPTPHVGLLGFRSHEGVRRNRGRIGAADGPAALRASLSPLALHGPLADGSMAILDHGDAITHGENLEAGQEDAAALTAYALNHPGNRLTVVLGGGHETAWPSYRGLLSCDRMRPSAAGDVPRWGVLNLDAHFDLRRADRPTSGTPFLQMAEAEAAEGRDLHYCVLGIAEPSNTPALFAEAERLGVQWHTDLDLARAGHDGIRCIVANFAANLDVLYLTIDLDVLPAAVAPGVSAPAALGVDPTLILTAVRAAAETGRLALMDVVELNPSLDEAGRTAKTAARLIDEAVRAQLSMSA